MSDVLQVEDVCYDGRGQRVWVFTTQSGWTDREGKEPLRELQAPDPVIGFHWGFDGSDPMQVAKAILADALAGEPSHRLAWAFRDEFVSQFPAEFRMRRGAILRWVRGYACELGQHDVPAELPPVLLSDDAYRRRRPSEGT